MDIEYLKTKILSCLSSDLLKPKYKGNNNPVYGHCYIVSECLYYLLDGKEAGLKPMHINHEGISHWWIKGPDNEICDLTASQFKTLVPYEYSRSIGFLTKQPCKRTKELIIRVLADDGGDN